MEGDKEVAVGGGVGRAARDGGGWNNLVETESSVSRGRWRLQKFHL